MIKLIYVVVITVVAVMVALFTYKNHQTVSIDYYWLMVQVKLPWLLLIAFSFGVVCSSVVAWPTTWRLRRRLTKAHKQIKTLQDTIEQSGA